MDSGAWWVGCPVHPGAILVGLAVLLGLLSATQLGAGVPDRAGAAFGAVVQQDTIIRDTILPVRVPPPGVLPPDSVRARLAAAMEGGAQFQPAVQVLPRNVPVARGGPPSRTETAIWEFDREALLATHALTLHDLLSFVPGIVLLRGGDYGNPVVATSAGLGPGQIRVFRDGVEDPPIEGGVVDLGRVGLAGLESVRVERRPAGLRIHLESLRISDVQPYTLLDVSTGDLQTNTFRATFAHPDALGGTLLLALDRVDTDGPLREEPGAVYGTHVRYALFPSEGRGISVHYRSRTSQRAEGVFRPREVNRTELGFRAGWEFDQTLTLETFGNRTSITPGGEADAGADTLLQAGARSLVGVRASAEWDGVWARAEGRVQGGDGWPSAVIGADAGGVLEGLGGATFGIEHEQWRDDDSGRSIHARVWTEPRWGLSAFAEVHDAIRGTPVVVPPVIEPDDENPDGGDDASIRLPAPRAAGGSGSWLAFQNQGDPPGDLPEQGLNPVRFGERQGLRVGVRGQAGALDLNAAYLRSQADSLAPMGLPFDLGGATVAGGTRTGVEIQGHVPLDRIRDGLFVSGQAQFWESSPQWRYHPDRSWAGVLGWHHTGYDSNLEVWLDAGARGRDGMAVPVAGVDTGLQTVPASLSWFARLQFRIVTVRVFVHWENFTLRDNLQDFPGRILPRTRAVYGIRWTMWN